MMCNNAGGRLVKTMLVEVNRLESKSVTVGCKYDYVKIYSAGDIGFISGRENYGSAYGQTLLVFNPSEKMLLPQGVSVKIKDEIISFENSSGDSSLLHVEAYKYD